MSTILKVDDLEIGMLITVHSYVPFKRLVKNIDMENGKISEVVLTIKNEERSYMGIPLIIEEMMLPYIIVNNFSLSALLNANRKIDIRDVNLMKCTEIYAKSILREDEWGKFQELKKSFKQKKE